MKYYYDKFGWLTTETLEGRSTEISPPDNVPEGHIPNWSGLGWVVEPYTEPPPPPPPDPRWMTSAEFIRRIPTDRWDAINQARLTNMTLQRLKDMLMTGDPSSKGDINLDSEELSQGLDYVVSLGLLTPEQKAALLT